MPISINNNGSWETIEEVYVNDNGTWLSIDEVYENNNGTWVLVFESLGEIVTFNGTRTATGSSSTFGLVADGTRSTLDDEVGTQYWINPQVGMNKYSVRCTTSGTPPDTGTLNTWLTLGSVLRSWSLNPPASGPMPRIAPLTLQFALTADTSTILQTSNVTLIANA